MKNPKKTISVEEIKKIIHFYRDFRDYPRGYLKQVNEPLVEYIHGFETALRLICDMKMHAEKFELACKQRGWRINSLHPIVEMREKGLNDEEIRNELLEIEVLTWENILSDYD